MFDLMSNLFEFQRRNLDINVTKLNLIAGEWTAGESEIENRNPSDLSDLIGMFAQAGPGQLDATLDRARLAQVEWAAYGLERKQAVLMGLSIISAVSGVGRGVKYLSNLNLVLSIILLLTFVVFGSFLFAMTTYASAFVDYMASRRGRRLGRSS